VGAARLAERGIARLLEHVFAAGLVAARHLLLLARDLTRNAVGAGAQRRGADLPARGAVVECDPARAGGSVLAALEASRAALDAELAGRRRRLREQPAIARIEAAGEDQAQ